MVNCSLVASMSPPVQSRAEEIPPDLGQDPDTNVLRSPQADRAGIANCRKQLRSGTAKDARQAERLHRDTLRGSERRPDLTEERDLG
jgi:hypothetical protein